MSTQYAVDADTSSGRKEVLETLQSQRPEKRKEMPGDLEKTKPILKGGRRK